MLSIETLFDFTNKSDYFFPSLWKVHVGNYIAWEAIVSDLWPNTSAACDILLQLAVKERVFTDGTLTSTQSVRSP